MSEKTINFKTEEELYKKIKIKIAKEGVTLKNQGLGKNRKKLSINNS